MFRYSAKSFPWRVPGSTFHTRRALNCRCYPHTEAAGSWASACAWMPSPASQIKTTAMRMNNMELNAPKELEINWPLQNRLIPSRHSLYTVRKLDLMSSRFRLDDRCIMNDIRFSSPAPFTSPPPPLPKPPTPLALNHVISSPSHWKVIPSASGKQSEINLSIFIEKYTPTLSGIEGRRSSLNFVARNLPGFMIRCCCCWWWWCCCVRHCMLSRRVLIGIRGLHRRHEEVLRNGRSSHRRIGSQWRIRLARR